MPSHTVLEPLPTTISDKHLPKPDQTRIVGNTPPHDHQWVNSYKNITNMLSIIYRDIALAKSKTFLNTSLAD